MTSLPFNQNRRILRALLVVGICASGHSALAGDGFIVQPKLRQNTRPSTASSSLPNDSTTNDSTTNDSTTPAKWPPNDASGQWPAPTQAEPFTEPNNFYEKQSTGGSLHWMSRDQSNQPTRRSIASSNSSRSTVSSPTGSHSTSLPASDDAPENTHSRVQATLTSAQLKQQSEERRIQLLAGHVSANILKQRTAPENGQTAYAIESQPGWQAVGERLNSHLVRCESLLRRGAYFSAREEALHAANYLNQVQDLARNVYVCEPLWLQAQSALREADDFNYVQRLNTDSDILRRIIESHETNVLKSADISQLSPIAATQHYQRLAQEKMVRAAQGHPWASDVFYMIGRTYQAEADAGSGVPVDALRSKAATYYRAALDVLPTNSIAANQLGFILLQIDKPSEARVALVASIQAKPTREAMQNLAEASRRLGDPETQQWAIQSLNAMGGASNGSLDIQLVNTRDFASVSPYNIGPKQPAVGSRPAPNQTMAPSGRVATMPSGPQNF